MAHRQIAHHPDLRRRRVEHLTAGERNGTTARHCRSQRVRRLFFPERGGTGTGQFRRQIDLRVEVAVRVMSGAPLVTGRVRVRSLPTPPVTLVAMSSSTSPDGRSLIQECHDIIVMNVGYILPSGFAPIVSCRQIRAGGEKRSHSFDISVTACQHKGRNT